MYTLKVYLYYLHLNEAKKRRQVGKGRKCGKLVPLYSLDSGRDVLEADRDFRVCSIFIWFYPEHIHGTGLAGNLEKKP